MFTRPDNSQYTSNIVSSDIDNAELAARLGLNRFRRSGRVTFYDDFASGLAWSYYNGKVYTYFNGAEPITPPGILSINPTKETHTPPFSGYANAEIPLSVINNIGFEVTLRLDATKVPDMCEDVEIGLWASTTRARIKWEPKTGNLSYLNASNSFTLFGTTTYGWYWHNIKMVVDILNRQYKYFMFNRDTYIINQPARQEASVSCLIDIYALHATTEYLGIMVDSAIVTCDESTR